MNSENNSPKNNDSTDNVELNPETSLDDFIKELEEKERELNLSLTDGVIEIEEIDTEDSEEKELEKLLASFEKLPAGTGSFTNSGNNYFPSHQASGLEREVLQLRGEVSTLMVERNEMGESLRRRQLEFENFRSRNERERREIFRNLLSELAGRMLPVVDNLTRALDATANYQVEKTKDYQQFVDGIKLVNLQINEVLEEMGIQPIKSVGQPFNPHWHEAVATEVTDEVAPNTVIAEILRGYAIDDKVIRHSMVKVSTGASAGESDEPSSRTEREFLDIEFE